MTRVLFRIGKYMFLLGAIGGILYAVFDIPVIFGRIFLIMLALGLPWLVLSLPVLAQITLQLANIVRFSTAYEQKNLPPPDKDNYTPQVRYSLPFRGKWTVVNGGVCEATSHAWDIPDQRYAYDFVILDEGDPPSTHRGNQNDVTSYHCYAQDILAPADGTVVKVKKTCRDSKIIGSGKADPIIKDIRGNYIEIQHSEGEFSVLAHLQPNSICVKKGDSVTRKQVIAKCGNTGNSTEPHLHFGVQSKAGLLADGLPIFFENIEREPFPNYSRIDPREKGLTLDQNIFISRGMRVWNK